MSLFLRSFWAAALALAGPVEVLAQSGAAKSSRIAWWSGGFEEAFAEAKARNVPLVFVFIQDGEEANERIVSGVFPDNEYVKAMRLAVPVVLSRELHGLRKETIDGQTRAVCEKFGGCHCKAHQDLEPFARAEFIEGDVKTPQHVFVLPDKSVVESMIDVFAAGAYVEALRKAQTKLGGKGVGADEYALIKKATADARRLLDAKDYGGAMKAVRSARAAATGTGMAKQLEDIAASVERAAAARLEEAAESERRADSYRALTLLMDGATVFADTDAAPKFKSELKRIRATKAGAEALRIVAREERAKPLIAAADKALADKDFVRAIRELEKAAKLAEGAPIAAEAQKRAAVLREDKDVKPLIERAEKEATADVALKKAEAFLRENDKAKARAALQEVVDAHKGTKAAVAAAKRLAEMK